MSSSYEQFWQKNSYHNLWQHSKWQEFQKKLGREAILFTQKPDEIHASALVIKHPLPLGLCWLEVPRGPLFQQGYLSELSDLLDHLIEYGRDQKAIFIRYSPYRVLNIPNRRKIIWDHHPQTSLILDLTQTEEQLLAQMTQKGRYNIRLAEKHGVTVQPSTDVAAFYALLQKTGERDQFGIHSQGYYQAMIDTLGTSAHLLLATHQNQVVAGGIFVYLDDWAIYYYGASDHTYRSLMAPYLIQWTAIREAQKRGCKHYDFLGIAPEGVKDHPWKGVTDFKRKFGGHVVHYPQAQEVVLRSFWYGLYRIYKR